MQPATLATSIFHEPAAVARELRDAHQLLLDGAYREAGRAFCRARPAGDFGRRFAIAGALRCADAACSAGERAPEPPRVVPAYRESVSAVVCSRRAGDAAFIATHLAEVFRDYPFEFVPIVGAPSMAAGYERGLRETTGEIVVFCHDDVELLHPHAADRLVRAMRAADVLGCAGTTRLAGDRWDASGPAHACGWIVHGDAPALAVGAYALARRADSIAALDGAFVASRREWAERIGFDARTFDAFHHYDLDFTHRAASAGARVVVDAGLWLRHRSAGSYDAAHARSAARFREKFSLPVVAGAPRCGWAVEADTLDRARGCYGWLEAWSA